ncbi:MAG: Gmad2 immunoglobulin-like domain-containing protein [Patescibacteria group bacterium]
MKKYLVLFGVLVLVAVGALYFFFLSEVDAPSVSTVHYVNATADNIVVASPKPGESLGSIIDVSGRARGMWYFEASFPIQVVDDTGAVIAQDIATADGEWMTEEFVPFTATITLTSPYTGPATLILKKDNPSGEASRDASMEIPIVIQ